MKLCSWYRRKFDDNRRIFLGTFFLTYCITLGIEVIVLALESNNSDVSRQGIDVILHWIEGVSLTAIPTTITFCGTVLLYQSGASPVGMKKTVVLTFIALLAGLNIAIKQTQERNWLIFFMFVALLLNIVSLVSSFFIIYDKPVGNNNHKKERTDGKICD